MENIRHILILGGNFRGKGAEAMMLTVRDAVKRVMPEAIFWVRPIYKEDKPQFVEHGFRTVERHRYSREFGLFHFFLGLSGYSRRRRIDSSSIGEKGLVNYFCVSDIVIDISGFRSSDQLGVKASLRRLFEFYLAKASGNKFVFMPQTWGPFENRWVRFFTRLVLRKADLVYAREKMSFDYLVEAGCIDTHQLHYCSDIAFGFKGSSAEAGRQVLARAGLTDPNAGFISLTPNIRVYERCEGKGLDNIYLSCLKSVVDYFLNETPYQIVLIPHEASRRGDNDAELCQMLIEGMGKNERVFMLGREESAAEIKSVIGLSEFLVASRYHSLIAGLSLRIPTAVIGWAHKYDEVMREVGLEKCVVDPVRREGEAVLDVIIDGWKQREAIREMLKVRVSTLEARSQIALDRMIDVVRTVGGSR